MSFGTFAHVLLEFMCTQLQVFTVASFSISLVHNVTLGCIVVYFIRPQDCARHQAVSPAILQMV